MSCYVMAGERGKALQTYAQCEVALRRELGTAPDESTRTMHLSIRKPSAAHSSSQPKIVQRQMRSHLESSLRHHYEKGRYFLAKRTESGFQHAESYFQECLKLDPECAPAHSGLADAQMLRAWFGYAPQKECYPRAQKAALNALNLEPQCAEAWTSLGYYQMNFEWDWHAAELRFQQAIDLRPNYSTAHQWYAELLATTGQMDEAIGEMRTALDLEPASLLINTTMAWMHYLSQDYKLALEQCQKTLELEPEFGTALWIGGQILIAQDEFAEAIPFLTAALERSGDHPGIIAELGFAYARADRKELARQCKQKLAALSLKNLPDPLGMALIDLGLDELNDAADWLAKSLHERLWLPPIITADPILRPLNDHPLFQRALKQMGLVGIWRH